MCYLHSVTANFSQNNYTVILHWFLYALDLFFLEINYLCSQKGVLLM